MNDNLLRRTVSQQETFGQVCATSRHSKTNSHDCPPSHGPFTYSVCTKSTRAVYIAFSASDDMTSGLESVFAHLQDSLADHRAVNNLLAKHPQLGVELLLAIFTCCRGRRSTGSLQIKSKTVLHVSIVFPTDNLVSQTVAHDHFRIVVPKLTCHVSSQRSLTFCRYSNACCFNDGSTEGSADAAIWIACGILVRCGL